MAFGKATKDPFASPLGKLIDNATVGTQAEADWGQFNRICDLINSSRDGPKEAVKALKKRIAKNRNYKEIQLALSLINCCMRNCGPAFHSLMVKREFVRDVLAKLLKPKYQAPIDVQNQVLHLIQLWATSSQGPVDLSDVRELYMEMIRKGLTFPRPALGPPDIRAEPVRNRMARKPESTPVQKHAASLAPYPMHGMTLVPEQLAKLNSELDLVHMNANVMSGILLENVPGSENPDDMQLLQKLHTTCREMQERISLLLLHLDQDNLTDHLLRANDDLNRIFVRYERFQRSRTRFQRMETKAETAKVSAVDPSAPCSSQDLISFTEMDPPAAPVFAAHFSSHVTDPQNGYFAVGNVNDGVPNVPSPTLSTLQPESILCHTDSGLEPLYSNVAPRRSAVLLAPTCSEFPGSPHDSLTWGHISELAMPGPRTESDCRNGRAPATSQSESSKMVGTHLIGLEFDPLVNGNYSSEPIYEELDMVTKP